MNYDYTDEPLDPGRCHEAVAETGRGCRIYQCTRRTWKEKPEARRCRQHHPETVAERRRAADREYAIRQYRRVVLPAYYKGLGKLAERLVQETTRGEIDTAAVMEELCAKVANKPAEPGIEERSKRVGRPGA